MDAVRTLGRFVFLTLVLVSAWIPAARIAAPGTQAAAAEAPAPQSLPASIEAGELPGGSRIEA